MDHEAAAPLRKKSDCTAYSVKRNETLCDILRKFDISVRTLKENNPECDLFALKPGQVLFVCRESMDSEKCYILEPDEDLCAVAQKFHQSVIALLKANPHLRPLEIREGIAINLPD